MAEIQQTSFGRNRRQRQSLQAPRVDMTPLVDLAFLLLTFFVLTSELSKQNAITTTFPKDGNPMKVQGMTLLLGDSPEKIFWYRGEFDPSLHLNVVNGQKDLFNVLKDANAAVYAQTENINRQYQLGLLSETNWSKRRSELSEDPSAPFVVVKWGENTSYETVVNVIDELNRTHNKKYAVVQVSEAEKELLK
jgi:biopolymer transport protein ExbD